MPPDPHPRQHPQQHPLSPETSVAIAIPVVALGVWWSLRRLHHRVFAARHR